MGGEVMNMGGEVMTMGGEVGAHRPLTDTLRVSRRHPARPESAGRPGLSLPHQQSCQRSPGPPTASGSRVSDSRVSGSRVTDSRVGKQPGAHLGSA